jgi:hypothetical protein
MEGKEVHSETDIAILAGFYHAYCELDESMKNEIAENFYKEFIENKSESEIQELLDSCHIVDLAVKTDEMLRNGDEEREMINSACEAIYKYRDEIEQVN